MYILSRNKQVVRLHARLTLKLEDLLRLESGAVEPGFEPE